MSKGLKLDFQPYTPNGWVLMGAVCENFLQENLDLWRKKNLLECVTVSVGIGYDFIIDHQK